MSTQNKWTPEEKFILLQYLSNGVDEIKKHLDNRTEVAIKTMARDLNMGNCYVSEKEKVSERIFCNDCKYDPKKCNKNVKKCIEKAKFYRQFNHIKQDTNVEDVEFITNRNNNDDYIKYEQLKMF